MFHRFGFRADVFAPLVLATALLPLGLLLPVVHFSWALKADTTFSVLTGTFDLLRTGHATIGLIILTFSILFPVAKILALYALWFAPLPAGARGSSLRWLEFLGKGSMLDVFVVGLLVWSLDLGLLSETTPRLGACVFTAAVLCSMAATLRQIRWARMSAPSPPVPARPAAVVPALAALSLSLLAAGLTFPLMEVDKWTFWSNEHSILGGTLAIFRQGHQLMAATVAAFVIAAPVLQVAAAASLWALGRTRKVRSRLASGIRIAGRWAMADVFALGVAVVLSRIGGVVNVTPRPGLVFFVAGSALGSGLCGYLTAPPADRRGSVRPSGEFHVPTS